MIVPNILMTLWMTLMNLLGISNDSDDSTLDILISFGIYYTMDYFLDYTASFMTVMAHLPTDPI